MTHKLLIILLTLQGGFIFAEANKAEINRAIVLEYCMEVTESDELCKKARPLIIGGEGGGTPPAGTKFTQKNALAKVNNFFSKKELGQIALKELTGLDLTDMNGLNKMFFKSCLKKACGFNNSFAEKNLLQNALVFSGAEFGFEGMLGGEGGN